MTDTPRYHRQMLLEGIGEAGQRSLRDSTALLVGCGALGTVIAELLTRAGVGRLRIVDRDLVELTNLQRQVLFDESDAREGLPKAEAARRRLACINSEIVIEPVVADFNSTNAERLARDTDAIVDGTDNFETRYLLNDLAVKLAKPYVYGGAVGTRGMVYTVMPHRPCLRCVFDVPAGGNRETCDTVGVLGPVAAMIASIESAEAIKLLSGNADRVSPDLLSVDLWSNTIRRIDPGSADPQCPCCGLRQFDYLEGDRRGSTTSLCGRNAVQIITVHAGEHIDLAPLADRLAAHGPVNRNEFLLRAEFTERDHAYQLTLFPDGRAIIHGTADPALAKSLYSRYVGL